jgi:Ca2+-binding RTX toxin-like protein
LGNVDVLGTVNNPNSFQGQNATEGASIAQLLANGATDAQVESELGLAAGALDALSPGNATDGSSMQTAIAVQEGDVVTFDWNFYNAENANDIGNGYDDFAIVNINGTAQTLAQSSTLGSPGATGWQTFTFTATEDGVLDLGFAMFNTRDQAVDSSLLIDNFEINGNTVDTRPVDLNLAISLADDDGSETIEIEISGVPVDASLSTGTNLGGGVWSVDQNDVSSLQLVPSATTSGTVTLTVSATATEINGGDTATATQNIDVEFETLDGPLFGTLGDDNLTGTANDDVIVARDGNDVISGGDGDDLIVGGAGNDILNGDAGDDKIYGGDGNDSLNGGAGNDILVGGAGNDIADGGSGDDVYVFEAAGDTDSFSGGNGGGWTDVVSLDVDISSLPNPSDPWTVTVDGNEVTYDVALGYLDLGPDASGSITFDDGSTVNFDGVEGIEW